ncbi:tRNA 4-thiouridine(8) synthase ThiI, partial [candidate division KSB1 bacterium]
GLDSTLAVKIMNNLGFKVIALNVETPFCKSSKDLEEIIVNLCGSNIEFIKEKVDDEYIKLVKNPPHGYGKHLNPCIDCKIFMLKKAKKIMETLKADVIFTGEVLGQRPMSQHSEALKKIEKESGLDGYLLRPLSAKSMKPTIPEEKGIIDRDKLYGFTGRGRKAQMRLAEKFGIKEYPSPAGGCLLTDEGFSSRLQDALNHNDLSSYNMSLLKIGRHFRIDEITKVICGRTSEENDKLFDLCKGDTIVFTVKGVSSTYVFLFGDMNGVNQEFAGGVAARYSKARNSNSVEIKWWYKKDENSIKTFFTAPIKDEKLKDYRL